jgi:hypothetical protein
MFAHTLLLLVWLCLTNTTSSSRVPQLVSWSLYEDRECQSCLFAGGCAAKSPTIDFETDDLRARSVSAEASRPSTQRLASGS